MVYRHRKLGSPHRVYYWQTGKPGHESDWQKSGPSVCFLSLDKDKIQFINKQLQCWITLYHLVEYLPL